jgi:hypothetical protein
VRFPVRHHQLVIDLVALYLDTKDTGRDAAAHEKLTEEIAEAKQAFALEFNLGPSALEWIHEGAGRTPTVGLELMPPLHVPSFGGGVVLEGASDTQRTDELQACDGYDIGPRGQLVAASDVSDYVTIQDQQAAPVAWSKIHLLRPTAGNNYVRESAVGEGLDFVTGSRATSTRISTAKGRRRRRLQLDRRPFGGRGPIPTPRAEGVLATIAQFSGVYKYRPPPAGPNALVNVFLVNIGAREGFAANLAPGLYAVMAIPPSPNLFAFAISRFDSLGTGERGEYAYDNAVAGTKGKQLYFRGIAAFNSFALGWGYDSSDTTDADGPARLMFSNVGKPLKWGNDNKGAAPPIAISPTRTRSSSATWASAFARGSPGAAASGSARVGSCTTSLATVGTRSSPTAPIPSRRARTSSAARARRGAGSAALWDRRSGLWAFDGGSFERHHKRLRNFAGHSLGWWDLIWTDRTRADAYPGKTNADLVWMTVDWDLEQVIVGIPWCNAAAGYGYGTDTVLVKFHTRTGGFTRQVFAGVQYTAGDYVRREGQFNAAKFLGTATAGTRR